ncbi:lysophospholipid acyltransferase family protein [soil metagenome]
MKSGWRLLAALLHICLGLLLCATAFPFWSEARRMGCVQWWSQRMLRAIGVRLQAEGTPSGGVVLIAANHVSWIDIVAINAVRPSRFVSKAEVRRWPLIGWMASCGGTLFIERERRRDALRVVHSIAEALSAGQTVAVFPEGTVGNGTDLLPFHANLLQAALTTRTPVQPVALKYTDASSAASGKTSDAVAYDGDITLPQSAARVLRAQGLTVSLRFLPPISGELERRGLATELARTIRAALN